jgi:hypothetical protein
MIIRDGRYERLRYLVMKELGQAQSEMSAAVRNRNDLAFEAAQDDVDEWTLLVQELDEAAPAELKRALGVN